ncbi:hypothetical protein FGO68_gene2756 [Halteria grandinella]|uniref:Uncharacterized protein n=1 Tax=Halteria grandinella TaxID=5974 RepID=A0A8J8NWH5_HALGN|nr:hypothetical protein FGO68_gene2756 [Halteria grandinella]
MRNNIFILYSRSDHFHKLASLVRVLAKFIIQETQNFNLNNLLMHRNSPAIPLDLKNKEQIPSKRGSIVIIQDDGKRQPSNQQRAQHRGLMSDTYSQAPTTSDSHKPLLKGAHQKEEKRDIEVSDYHIGGAPSMAPGVKESYIASTRSS